MTADTNIDTECFTGNKDPYSLYYIELNGHHWAILKATNILY